VRGAHKAAPSYQWRAAVFVTAILLGVGTANVLRDGGNDDGWERPIREQEK
jgi:hypothetical protein